MPETYTKLFNSILTSTVWDEDAATRLVWITMLAMADQHGEVYGSVPGLAHMARVDRPDCERALERLSSPDPDSRSSDHAGRRIEKIDGGWGVLNHAKYRSIASKEERQARDRERKRREYARRKGDSPENLQDSPPVSASPPHASASSLHAEAEEQGEEQKKTPPSPPRGEKFSWTKEIVEGHPLLDNPKVIKRVGELVTYRRESKLRPWKPVTWKKNLEEWSSWGDPALVLEAIDNSIRNGWQSVNYPKGDRRDGSKPEFTPRKKRCKVV